MFLGGPRFVVAAEPRSGHDGAYPSHRLLVGADVPCGVTAHAQRFPAPQSKATAWWPSSNLTDTPSISYDSHSHRSRMRGIGKNLHTSMQEDPVSHCHGDEEARCDLPGSYPGGLCR
jgi:hypothetical protein